MSAITSKIDGRDGSAPYRSVMTDALILLPGGSPVPIDPAVIDAARRAMSEASWRALRADMRVLSIGRRRGAF